MNRPLIFVYGTLRRTCTSGAHQRFLSDAEFLGDAFVSGRLYKVSYYPALVLDTSASRVKGEVYRLVDSDQLDALDHYEECPTPAGAHQEYRRELASVQLSSGQTLNTWIYVYQRPVNEHMLIASGDFLVS